MFNIYRGQLVLFTFVNLFRCWQNAASCTWEQHHQVGKQHHRNGLCHSVIYSRVTATAAFILENVCVSPNTWLFVCDLKQHLSNIELSMRNTCIGKSSSYQTKPQQLLGNNLCLYMMFFTSIFSGFILLCFGSLDLSDFIKSQFDKHT